MSVVRELLDEQLEFGFGPSPCCPSHDPVHETAPPAIRVLGIVRGAAKEALACAWIARVGRAGRRDLVSAYGAYSQDQSCLAPVVTESLLEQFCADVCASGATDQDVHFMTFLPPFPETCRGALTFWAPRTTTEPRFFEALARNRALDELLDVPLRDEAARRLVLGVEGLVEVLGDPGLRREIRAAIAEKSAYDRGLKQDQERAIAQRSKGPIRPNARDRVVEQRFEGALRAIATWGGGPASGAGLVVDEGLDETIRARVALAVFARDREAAERAVARDGSPRIVRAMVAKIAQDPVAADGPFLRDALAFEDDVARARAVDALDALGEDDAAWRELLRAFAHGGTPLLRARAAAALARRGEDAYVDVLLAAARDRTDHRTHAEAIRRLGELDGVALSMAFFEETLARAVAHAGPYTSAATHAAVALAVHFGERAMAPLLRAQLQGLARNGNSALETCLVALGDEAYLAATPRERRARILAARRRRAGAGPYPDFHGDGWLAAEKL